MRESRPPHVLGWSESEPPRKWTVWIEGKKKGEVLATDPKSAVKAARRRWRSKPTAAVDVRPKFPLAQDVLEDKAGVGQAPSTLHDAHIVKVALATLEWTRETLRSRAVGVRNADLDNLLGGRSSGFVRTQVFEVLSQAGCDPVEIGQMIIRVKENAERAKARAVTGETGGPCDSVSR